MLSTVHITSRAQLWLKTYKIYKQTIETLCILENVRNGSKKEKAQSSSLIIDIYTKGVFYDNGQLF